MALVDNWIHYRKLDTNWSANDAIWSFDMTINWALYTAAWKINGAYSFDWVNDSITRLSSTINFWSSWLTASAWVKVGAQGVYRYAIAHFDGTSWFLFWISNTGKPYWVIRWLTNPTTHTITWNTSINDDAWHLILMSYDDTSGTLDMYVDGSSDATQITWITTTNINTTTDLNIGEYASIFLSWVVDEPGIRIWPTSAAEVSELWNGGVGLQYPFWGIIPSTFTPIVNWF